MARTTGKVSKSNVALWTAQGLLAAVFLFAGGSKLAMPMEMLAAVSPIPALILKFVACCEVLGAFGLLLPGIFRIHRALTPLAAAGLTVIVICATIATLATSEPVVAILPLVVTILSATVAYGRRDALGQLRGQQRANLQLAA